MTSTLQTVATVSDYHQEVVDALTAVSQPEIAEAIRQDRGSQMQFLGVRTPALRAVLKKGFSFSSEPDEQVLQIWNDLWMMTPYAEVMAAACEYYGQRARKHVSLEQWAVQKKWVHRLDNWAHADGLAAIYSRILEKYPSVVFEQMQAWNQAENEWLRRLSLVSLIHYTGKNAVFLPLDQVLPLVTNCLADHRHYVEKALGWVLREMGHTYPSEVRAYIEEHACSMSSTAFRRAIERRSTEEKAELKAVRATCKET